MIKESFCQWFHLCLPNQHQRGLGNSGEIEIAPKHKYFRSDLFIFNSCGLQVLTPHQLIIMHQNQLIVRKINNQEMISDEIDELSLKPLTNHYPDRQTNNHYRKYHPIQSNQRQKARLSMESPHLQIYSSRPRNVQSQYIKSKNKGSELSPYQDQSKVLDDHFHKIKSELQSQIAKNKELGENLKKLEWRQRQLTQVCRQCRDEADKTKQKLSHSSSLLSQQQATVAQNQKTIKKLQQRIQSLKQQNQEKQSAIKSLNNRISYKEQYFTTQLTNVTEKYHHSQQQKQKSFFQVNSMLENYQKVERQHQLASKQKEIGHVAEMTQLLRKIEQFNREKDRLKEEINSKEEEYNDAIEQKKRIEAKLQQQRSETLEHKFEIKNLETALNKQHETVHHLNKKLLQLEYSIAENSNKSKKQADQLKKLLTKSKQELEKSNKENKSQKIHNKQLQNELVAKSEEIVQLENKNKTLAGQISTVKDKTINLQKQLQKLNDENVESNIKIQEFKNRYQQLQNSQRLLKSKLEDARKQQHRDKEKLSKQNQEYREKNSQLEGSVANLERKQSQFQKNAKKTEEQREKLKNQLKRGKQQYLRKYQEANNKQKQLESTIQSQGLRLNQQTEQISKLQEQLSSQKQDQQKAKNANSQFTEQINNLKEEKKNLSQELIKKCSEIDHKSQQLSKGSKIIEDRDQQIVELKNMLNNSSNSSINTIKQLEGQLSSIQSQLQASVEKNREISKEMAKLQKQLSHTKSRLKNLELSNDAQTQKLTKQLNKKVEECNNANLQLSHKIKELKQLAHESQKIKKQLLSIKKANSSSNQNAKALQSQIQILKKDVSDITRKWESERAIYIPIKQKFDKLNAQINRYTNSTTLIQNNSAKLLEISRNRAHEDELIPQSAGKLLRDIQNSLMKLKTKILKKHLTLFQENTPFTDRITTGRYRKNDLIGSHSVSKSKQNIYSEISTSGKEEVLFDFKAIQEKIEGAIRSYHIVMK